MIRLYLLTPLELILTYVVEDKPRAGETQVKVNVKVRAAEMAARVSIRCLQNKYKDPSLNPHHPHESCVCLYPQFW